MPGLDSTHLAVFMTRGMSLALWERQGGFEREVAMFRALRPRLAGLSLVTYGGAEDKQLAGRLPGIEILFNRWGLPGPLYTALVSRLHAATLARAHVLRTNQVKGAEAALAARRIAGGRLIVRCGYLWSLAAAEFNHGLRGRWNYAEARRTERAAFGQADAIIVTTQPMKQYVADVYAAPAERIRVIPNFVLDEFFEERPAAPGRRIVFVGRLEPDKNPIAAIEAARGLDAEVTMIGRGSLRPELALRAAEANVRVRFIPQVPHRELPGHLAGASAFILPSPREGHPKTLLEAMAAGVAVIGRDAPGIREIIRHEETGLLAGDDGGFHEAAARLLADPVLRARLGRNAREFARAHYSFEKALAAETSLLADLVETRSGAD